MYSLADGVQLCSQNHIFLGSNKTNGATLTYSNTLTQELHNITFEGHYLPPSSMCGERNGRCGMSTLFNLDGTILVAVVPFGDGIGLVSYQFDNVSMIYREKLFLSYSDQNCVPAFFPPFPDPLQPVLGYCLDLLNHRIKNLLVNVNFDRLNGSYAVPAIMFFPFDFQGGTVLSNFLYFPEESMNNCFFVEKGRTIFLSNSDLIDHDISNMEYNSEIGSIDIPDCSTSEPRLQSLLTRTECKLAVYCSGTAALFNVPDSFGGVTDRFSGDVYFCSSNFYVRFLNSSLSVHRVSNDERISALIPLDAETILLGDCLTFEEPFYFVASLSDARAVFANFSNLAVILLGENTNPTLLPYTVVDKLLFVNNETHSLIYNWTRISMCPEDLLAAPINFDLVHSFSDQSLSEECECVRDIVTTATPTDDTTTNQIESTTYVASTTETTSRPTTARPTNPPAIGLSVGEIVGTATGIAVLIVIFILIMSANLFICLEMYVYKYVHKSCHLESA